LFFSVSLSLNEICGNGEKRESLKKSARRVSAAFTNYNGGKFLLLLSTNHASVSVSDSRFARM
jgi:hypothetical protein